MQRSFLIALASIIFLMPAATLAQSLSTPAPVQYIVSPENPGPGELVDITVEGVGDFLGNSNVIWTVDGVTKQQGVGSREFSFTTGALGHPTTVSVTIQSTAYGTLRNQWVFNPSRIDLVWEAHTSAPPFYAGKPLPSAGSQITVYAFPEVLKNGSALSVSGLSFQWKLDGAAQPNQSGLGRNAFTFSANQLHQGADVTVAVNSGNTEVGQGEVNIPFATPFIALYIHDPLRGVLYNRALANAFAMPAIEETLRAEPFYFSTESFGGGALSYNWQLNGQTITGPNTAGGELTMRQTGQGQGSASLTVALQNSDPSKLLQAAQTALSIVFGSRTSNTASGSTVTGNNSGSTNPFGL